MTTERKDNCGKSPAEKRQSKKQRRRLVDLTRMAGTDRRETKMDRRKTNLDQATERPSEKDKD